ncbi:hypothetical protein M0802_013419 [Mischocyttarus mexicanus]|nr:hypothetical protein M0802_013419 [Mischocyttarus mexicanus]
MENITTVIVSIAVIIKLFYVIKYLINKFREYNLVKNFSGPKAFPIIGNSHLFLGNMEDITNKLMKLDKNYSSIWRLWIGPKLLIILNDLESIEILSNSPYGFEKGQSYDGFIDLVGNGLITASTSKWQVHRKIVNPLFKAKTFLSNIDPILKNSNRLSTVLETSRGKEINIYHYLHLCTLDIVFDTFLGSDLDLQNIPECKFDEYISEMLDLSMQRVFKFWLHPNIIYRYSSLGKKVLKIYSDLTKITSEIIKKKKESMQEGKIIRDSEERHAGENTNTFLDLLIESFYDGGEYSEKDIHDEINTIVLAGSETTAATINFVFLMLANYPEIQNQIYQELYQIYGSNDPKDFPITYQDIKNMKFLERVIKETFRLFPVGPWISRTYNEDIRVNEDLVIPRNSEIIISIFSLHRNEKYWKDPLTFNPDRFLPANYNAKCFIPFSFGKRGCIGQTFAMIEMKGIIATILRKYIVQIDNPVKVEDVELKVSTVLKPVKPLLLRFYKR